MSSFKNSKAENYTSKQINILESKLKDILQANAKKEEGIGISLQGSCGIGKTYFWNDFAKRDWNEYQQVYILLDDIKNQIVFKK